MAIQFYNSLTNQLEPFEPRKPKHARMYHCGPTVYKRQHIGNMRRFLWADFLRRTLELHGFHIEEVTNITDVGHLTQDEIDAGEDKVAKAAREEQVTAQMIAIKQTELFQQDLASLNILPSQHYPRASDHIKAMQRLITTLLEKQHAYITASGVYFDVTSFPHYGQLSGNTLAQLSAGARVEVRGDKHHPADFALWILDEQALQRWESPWGKGYPGWHIECSAMSLEYLGSDIDIHTGGEDNRFPHHENEIAQSEAATGERFVRVWLHTRHLRVSGKKMAKSGGTHITLDTLQERGYSALAFRLLVLGTHYRSPMEFSWESLDAAQENLHSWRHLLRQLLDLQITMRIAARAHVSAADTAQRFNDALADDLNTPAALAVVAEYMREINTALNQGTVHLDQVSVWLATLGHFDRVLGILEPLQKEINAENVPTGIYQQVTQREEARQAGNFAEADRIRNEISSAGFTIHDTPLGPRIHKNY